MSQIFTLQGILGAPGLRNEVLYVVKSSNKEVIYVGMANKQSVADRMTRHIGHYFTTTKPSCFSKLLFNNHPHYFNWKVEIFSRCEAEIISGKKHDCLSCAERGLYDFYREQNNGVCPSGNARRPNSKCTA